MIGSELFRQRLRAPAVAVIGCVNWFATLIIALAFENIQVSLLFFIDAKTLQM